MKRHHILHLGLLAAGSTVTTGWSDAPQPLHPRNEQRPNILFIFTDQQTLRAMSAMGNPYLQTPAMDSLARAGVRFEQSYCTAPICSASRGSLLTGRMPHQTGVVYNGGTLRPDLPNLGTLFRAAGYRTVWAGKWHLPDSYPVSLESGRQAAIPGFELLPFHDMDHTANWGRGEHTDIPLADAAIRFLRSAPATPFLLAVSFHNPHDICYFADDPTREPQPLDLAALPPLPSNHIPETNEPRFILDCRQRPYYGSEVHATRHWTAEQWRHYVYHYYRLTEQVDRQIGRLLDTLDETGLEENTLILFTSDHGDGAAAHQWAAKLSLYEESVRVPMILCGAGIRARGVLDRDHLVSGLDVVPTLCDYAGIVPPAGCRGQSLRTLVENPAAPWRDQLVTELAVDPKQPDRQGRMLRTQHHKYIRFSYGETPEQLFNLANDPGEQHNLAGDPASRAVLDAHRQRLDQWMKDEHDPFKTTPF